MQKERTTFKKIDLPAPLCTSLPPHLLESIRGCGAERAEELRLHAGRVTRVKCAGLSYATDVTLDERELSEILKKMCGGSLYAYAETINQGYLTLDGGIRVGVCGTAATNKGQIIGIGNVTGLTVRIPHAVHVSVGALADSFLGGIRPHGMLLYSLPGVGKTTFLRALAAELSSPHRALHAVVVDSREEIGPMLRGNALALDILSGYPRAVGIEIATRSLCADVILCDEIGSPEDAEAILAAANCGVPIIASAHAASCAELLRRPSIRTLHDALIFGAYVGLTRSEEKELSYCFLPHAKACRLANG